MLVQQGRLPAGIEGRLAEWGAFLAVNGTAGEFDEIAAEVISGCR